MDSNYKYPESDFTEYQAQKVNTPWECLQQCKASSNCKFWSMNKEKFCYLKNEAAPSTRVYLISSFSGGPDCPGTLA